MDDGLNHDLAIVTSACSWIVRNVIWSFDSPTDGSAQAKRLPQLAKTNGTRIQLAMLKYLALILTVCAWHTARAQDAARPAKANRLAGSASPYLLQHAHNPVDWYPWGKEAFERAEKEDKPIFLSVGYSACHWCHVMERESFSDPAIAKLMNEAFVCVKVDREERPDVDAVYMAALQAFSGGGGWPMNVILTPDGRPFFGMTYMPPRDRDGDEGFATLIARVRAAWRDNRKELEHDAGNLAAAARRLAAAESGLFRRGPIRRDLAAHTLGELADQFDPNYGGFGSTSRQPKSPKFPEPSILMFLWDLDANPPVLGDARKAAKAREMALTTMDAIARGGIRDHLGGGIHRYSTDRYWTVPHFEKMLYDNALWLTVTATAFARTGDPRWQAEVEETVDFLKSVMLQKTGGFDSALDADTEAVEGLTYLWTRSEIEKAIAGEPDADLFLWVYGLKMPPNFENRDHILAIAERWPSLTAENKLSEPEIRARLAPMRKKLLEIRNRRKQPFEDDKCLTSWNGLVIGGLADAARLAKHPMALGLAENAARFLLTRHLQGSNLRHVSRGDAISPDGPFLEDYAYFIFGLLKLHEASGQANWLDEARKLAGTMIDRFEDTRHGGFFETVEGSTDLFVRPRNWFDSALPSPAGIATLVLAELAQKTGARRFAETANRSLQAASGYFSTAPDAVLSFVRAAVRLQAEMPELASAMAAPMPVEGEPKPEKPAARKKPKPVKAEIVGISPLEVVAGKPVTVTLKLTIDEGFHTYSNPPTNDTARPTELKLDEAASGTVKLAAVDYPGGKLKSLSSTGLEPVAVYEKEANLDARLEVPADAPAGLLTAVLVLEYQVCTEQFCLPPAKDRIPVELKVARP